MHFYLDVFAGLHISAMPFTTIAKSLKRKKESKGQKWNEWKQVFLLAWILVKFSELCQNWCVLYILTVDGCCASHSLVKIFFSTFSLFPPILQLLCKLLLYFDAKKKDQLIEKMLLSTASSHPNANLAPCEISQKTYSRFFHWI